MKKYQNFILEFIRNEKNVKWYLKKLLTEIKSLNSDDFYYHTKIDRDIAWELDATTTIEYEKQSIKIIKKYQNKLLKDNTYLYYSIHYEKETLFDPETFDINIKENGKNYVKFHFYVKNIHIKRIIPSKYVYHISPSKNRESILETGLKTNENINFSDSPSLNHPPMIFASMNEPLWKRGTKDTDTWQIDTTKINNVWWSDPNMIQSYKGEDMITTFENIPPEALILLESF